MKGHSHEQSGLAETTTEDQVPQPPSAPSLHPVPVPAINRPNYKPKGRGACLETPAASVLGKKAGWTRLERASGGTKENVQDGESAGR